MSAKYQFIRASNVRRLVKENGKRCGRGFLEALDNYVRAKILRCINTFNGHRVTLDESLINLTK